MTDSKKQTGFSTAVSDWSWPMPWQQRLDFVVAFAAAPILLAPLEITAALAYGLFMLACLVVTQPIITLVKVDVKSPLRWLIYILIINVIATVTERWWGIWFFDLYSQNLIVLAMGGAQLLLLAHSDWVAARQPLLPTLISSVWTGLMLLVLVLVVTTLRQLAGPLFSTPGGGLIILGLLLAMIRWLTRRRMQS